MKTSLDDNFLVSSASPNVAGCTPILLHETDAGDRRIVFHPKVVENADGDSKGVSGAISYERAGTDGWGEDTQFVGLNRLKAGQGYKISLTTEATHLLSCMLQALYQFRREQGGVPYGTKRFRPSDIIEQLEAASSEQVRDFVASTENAEEVLGVIRDLDVDRLQDINTVAGLATLKQALEEWKSSDGDEGEEYWQQQLLKYPAILSQLFAHPTVIHQREAYLGGKAVDNTGGHLTDFLMRGEATRNAVIVEIKKPSTSLLRSTVYRGGTYNISRELSGAVQQVRVQKQSLVEEYKGRVADTQGEHPSAFSPRCIVIVGNTNELDRGSGTEKTNKRKNFELFRSDLRTVEVVTFDELFQKVKTLVELLEDTVSPDSGVDDSTDLNDQLGPPPTL